MLYKQIARNRNWTPVLLGVGGLVAVAATYWWIRPTALGLGYLFAVPAATVVSLVTTLRRGEYFVLRELRVVKARRADYPALHSAVEDMAIAAGIKKPAVLLIPTDSVNLGAVGRSVRHSAVMVTEGLAALDLPSEDLRALIAHEVAHIANRDTVLCTMLAAPYVPASQPAVESKWGFTKSFVWALRACFVWVCLFLGAWLLLPPELGDTVILHLVLGVGALVMILLTLAAIVALLQGLVTENRDFLADATAVLLTRQPESMIRALRSVEGEAHLVSFSEWSAELLQFYPKREYSGWEMKRIGAQPSVDRRIDRLRHTTAVPVPDFG